MVGIFPCKQTSNATVMWLGPSKNRLILNSSNIWNTSKQLVLCNSISSSKARKYIAGKYTSGIEIFLAGIKPQAPSPKPKVKKEKKDLIYKDDNRQCAFR